MSSAWQAVVLAAGRGPEDPMAKAYGASHKCTIEIDGIAMLRRVVQTLTAHPDIAAITISIDAPAIAERALEGTSKPARIIRSEKSAAGSAAAAVRQLGGDYPVLLTTADHPLLNRAMLDHFLREASASDADLCAGLATAETILAEFPEAKRTYLTFGRDRVSGCNLFALMNDHALKALDFWTDLDQLRKKPWRLVSAFGVAPLLRYLSGMIDLQSAFRLASARLGITAKPVLMPFAEASIDVDKPQDKELAEKILRKRRGLTT